LHDLHVGNENTAREMGAGGQGLAAVEGGEHWERYAAGEGGEVGGVVVAVMVAMWGGICA